MQFNQIQQSTYFRTSFFLIALAIFSTLSFNTVDAYTVTRLGVEDSEDFVVEPGKTELFLNPGETVTRNISVTNRTNRELNFRVGVENFVGSDNPDSTVVLLPAGVDTPYPLNEFVSTELEEFSLKFGERMTFAITVTTPPDIEPGGHYGAIIISNESTGALDGNGSEVVGGTRLTSRIGSLVLMRINGDVNESGSLENFEISGPNKFFRQTMPTSFEMSFRNDGSVHLVPYGTINIKNIFGARVAQVPVDAYFALPDSLRYQEVSWPGKKFSFGLYNAELELYKGYGNQVENANVRFVVLPLIVILPTVAIFILLFLAFHFISKRFVIQRK